MKNNIKLYTIDLDGTLLDKNKNGEKYISEKNIRKIAEVKNAGNHIVISTGRVGKSAKNIIDLLPNDFAITGNGSEIINPNGKIIYSEKLSVKQNLKILEIATKYKLCIKPDNFYQAFGVKNFIQRKIVKSIGWTWKTGYSYPLQKEYKKIVVFGSISKSKMNKVAKELSKIIGVIALTSFKGFTIEITSEKATKGIAAKFVADKLNLKRNQIAHIGDTMNDSTTVKFVGSLIAMKNSSKKLKKIATHIGPNYKKGGVAKILNGEYKKNRQ